MPNGENQEREGRSVRRESEMHTEINEYNAGTYSKNTLVALSVAATNCLCAEPLGSPRVIRRHVVLWPVRARHRQGVSLSANDKKNSQGGVTLSYVCPHCHRYPLEDHIWSVSTKHGDGNKKKKRKKKKKTAEAEEEEEEENSSAVGGARHSTTVRTRTESWL